MEIILFKWYDVDSISFIRQILFKLVLLAIVYKNRIMYIV